MRNHTITLSLVAVLFITGCSTLYKPGNPKTIEIKMTHSGECQIDNKIIPASNIIKGIKSAGGKKDSRIAIIIPKDMSYSSVKKILVTLSEAGYIKVHLQNPREAISYVNKDKKQVDTHKVKGL